MVRALYRPRLRGLVAVLPSDLTAEILAASEKMTGVGGFTQNCAPFTYFAWLLAYDSQ